MQRAVWVILLFCILRNAVLHQAQEETTPSATDVPSTEAGQEENETATTPATGPEENETTTTTAVRWRRPERTEVVSFSSWKLFLRTNLTVDPKQAVTLFTIPIPKEGDDRLPARFNITFTIPDFPDGCNPNTTLWFSPAVYYTELCMERDWMGECTLPSKDGFREEQELVDNYGRFKRVIFDYDVYEPRQWELKRLSDEDLKRRQRIRKTLKGTFCYDDRDYWLAFSTSCANATNISIEIGLKDLNFVDRWTCRGFDHFMLAQHGSDAFASSRLFWAILIPIGYFAFLTALILGCGYCFQCGAQGRVTMLLKMELNFDFDDSDDSEEDESRRSPRRRKKKH